MSSRPKLIFLIIIFATLFSIGVTKAAWRDAPAGPPNYDELTPGSGQADYKPMNLGLATQIKQGKIGAAGFFDKDDSSYLLDLNSGSIAGTFAGSVGIGQVMPGAKLTVNNPTTAGKVGSSGDAIYAYSDSGNAAISAEQANSSGYAIYTSGGINRIENSTSNAWLQFSRGGTIIGGIGANTANQLNIQGENQPIRFSANGFTNEHMRITPTGKVGIGTPAPSGELEVKNPNSTDDTSLWITSGGYWFYIINQGSDGSVYYASDEGRDQIFKVRENSTTYWDALTIKSNGKIGIGTPGPGYKLDVQGGQINSSGGLCMAGDCKTSWAQVVSGGGGITGVGNANYVSKWTSDSNLGPSLIYDNGVSIGIGTTGPANKLEVYAGSDTSQILWGQNIKNEGNANVTGYGAGLKLKISSEGSVNETNKWAGLAAVAGSGWSNRTDLAIYVSPSSASPPAEKVRITGDGYVGIGTSPSSRFHIHQSANGWNDGIRISNASGSTVWKILSDGGSSWLTFAPDDDYSKGMVIRSDNGGRVGIGMNGPSYKLDVAGDVNITGTYRVNGVPISTGGLTSASPATDNKIPMWTSSGTRLTDSVITQSGTNVNIGTVGYSVIAAAFVDSENNSYYINPAGGTSAVLAGDIGIGGSGTAANGWFVSSDARLKKNVETLSGALEKLGRTRGVSYDLASGQGARQIGVIAQELEQEFPELVKTDDNGYKAVAYDKLSAVLIEAVKELQSQNQAFQSRLDLLEKK